MTEKLTASRADRLMACPSSGNLEIAIPGWTPPEENPEKFKAKGKGDEIHNILKGAMNLKTSELRALITALEYATQLREGRRFKVETEHTFEVEWLSQPVKTRVDLMLHLSGELHIFDWKTGKIVVNASNNAQMMFYALAALRAGFAPNAKSVHLHIVQPWAAGHIDHHEVTLKELAEFETELLATDAMLQAKTIKFNVTDNCKFCPAFPHARTEKGYPLCPEALSVLYPVQELDEAAILEE